MLEIDFDAGIQNALSAQRQITNELRAQSNELQKLERTAGRLQPRLATAADYAKLGITPGARPTPRAATQADLNRLLGIKTPGGKSLSDAFAKAKAADASAAYRKGQMEAAARGEIAIGSGNFGGRTGGLAAMRGISDAEAQRVFNARFDRAVEGLQRNLRARNVDGFTSGRAKGFLTSARALAKGSFGAGLKSFGGNTAMLLASGASAGEAAAGAGFGALAGLGGPVGLALAAVGTLVQEIRNSNARIKEISGTVNTPYRLVDKLFDGRPGAQQFKQRLQLIGSPNEQKDFLAKTLPTLAKEYELTAAVLNEMFKSHVVNNNRQSVNDFLEMSFADGKMSAEALRMLEINVQRQADKINKPLTTKQQQDMREQKNRANAWDKFNMMQKQEWNPA